MSDFRGIVLTNTIIHDNDVMMNVLTEEGKISIKAKGVLKAHSKNRNVTEIGCISLFHTIDRNNQSIQLLKNAERYKYYIHLQNDLIRKAIYDCFLEIFNKTDISFTKALEYIEILDSAHNPYCIYALLLCDVMKNSGISLVVDECVLCSSKEKLMAFSIHDGGFICLNCFDPLKHLHLEVQELKNIRYCMHAKVKDYDILEKNTSFDFESLNHLIQFLHTYGEITIKSHSFLEVLQPLA